MKKRSDWKIPSAGVGLSVLIHLALVAVLCGMHPFAESKRGSTRGFSASLADAEQSKATVKKQQPEPPQKSIFKEPRFEFKIEEEKPASSQAPLPTPVSAVIEPVNPSEQYPALIE